MARTVTAERKLRVSLYHCASVPPAEQSTGMFIQGIVPAVKAARHPVVPIDFCSNQLGKVNGLEFVGVQSDNYWSNTTNVNKTANPWTVNLNSSSVGNIEKTDMYCVWPVRGGE